MLKTILWKFQLDPSSKRAISRISKELISSVLLGHTERLFSADFKVNKRNKQNLSVCQIRKKEFVRILTLSLITHEWIMLEFSNYDYMKPYDKAEVLMRKSEKIFWKNLTFKIIKIKRARGEGGKRARIRCLTTESP